MWQISIGSPPAPIATGEVDTQLEWFVAISTAAGVWAWPLTLGFVLWLLREPLKEMIPRIKKAGAGPVSLDFSEALTATTEIALAVPEEVAAAPTPEDLPAVPGEHIEGQSSTANSGEGPDTAAGETEVTPKPKKYGSVGKDSEFPEWAFRSEFTTGDAVRDQRVKHSLEHGGMEQLQLIDPAAAVLMSYWKVWRMLDDGRAFPYQNPVEWLSGSFWPKKYVPHALHQLMEMLRVTAIAARQGAVSEPEARTYAALADTFIATMEPFIQAYAAFEASTRKPYHFEPVKPVSVKAS